MNVYTYCDQSEFEKKYVSHQLWQRGEGRHSSRLNLRDVNLQRLNFAGYDLGGATFMGCAMLGSNFEAAQLVQTSFIATYLEKSCFDRANCHLADFGHADLTQASFRNANVETATFWHATLIDANFEGANINWQSHDLLSEILRQHALTTEQLKIAGLLLVSRHQCWNGLLQLAKAEADQENVEWAKRTLLKFALKDSECPPLMLQRLSSSNNQLPEPIAVGHQLYLSTGPS